MQAISDGALGLVLRLVASVGMLGVPSLSGGRRLMESCSSKIVLWVEGAGESVPGSGRCAGGTF